MSSNDHGRWDWTNALRRKENRSVGVRRYPLVFVAIDAQLDTRLQLARWTCFDARRVVPSAFQLQALIVKLALTRITMAAAFPRLSQQRRVHLLGGRGRCFPVAQAEPGRAASGAVKRSTLTARVRSGCLWWVSGKCPTGLVLPGASEPAGSRAVGRRSLRAEQARPAGEASWVGRRTRSGGVQPGSARASRRRPARVDSLAAHHTGCLRAIATFSLGICAILAFYMA